MSLAQYTGADIESGIVAGLHLTCSTVCGVTRLIFTCYPECPVVAYCSVFIGDCGEFELGVNAGFKGDK